MLTEKYDFRITDQMTIPLRPHWIANDSYREKCKMLVLNRSKGEIHKVDFSKVTDYIKEGDVICFNDSTIINHMFICKTRRNRLIKIVLEGFLPNWPEINSKSPERMAAEYPCSSYREWRSAGKNAIRCVIMLSSDSVNTPGGNKMNVTYTT